MNIEHLFVVIGILCLLTAIVGGGLKGFGFEFPTLQSKHRQVMLGVLGIILIISSQRIKIYGYFHISDNKKTRDENAKIHKENRPNFITIIFNDLGFSDLSIFGSEIPTPNIDQLAKDGIMLTNFYAAPTSMPSLAMLFTGKDNHAAGLGIMASMIPRPEQLQADRKTPLQEYQGRLSLDVPTFPELLQQNGYYTMFTGKWALAGLPDISEGMKLPDISEGMNHVEIIHRIADIQKYDPVNRGFDVTSAALMRGGTNHFSDRIPWELQSTETAPNLLYTKNGIGMDRFFKDFYSTDYYTGTGIQLLNERDRSKPFYLCLSYTAPSAPLQAPVEYIEKYLDSYSKGWDSIRDERFARQKQIGLWQKDANLPSVRRKWSELNKDEQEMSAKRMAVYAAMIDILDDNIGQLIKYLKESELYDNILIFLHSSNGGGYVSINTTPKIPCDNSYGNIGNANSYLGVDEPEWATAMNAPFASYKGSTNEGGWHTPAILHYPKSKVTGKMIGQVASVMDIAPTILEMAGITYPVDYKGKANELMTGVSMADMLKGQPIGHDDRFVAFEMNGKIGVRSGDWKLVKESVKVVLNCSI